ncbi:Bidirectional sugar transporter like [Actinidia chinensis var. chinensis]|uniref:Bidirectional sugar transporter SWEET n=1 Tax=Actinidia chinensis var. chinensis TaxID=1590841 RepID=A0A2R6QRF9_ACTCC|nr:Bidirectional sugar transporter like [Actinidia chinensis var. chinensis]
MAIFNMHHPLVFTFGVIGNIVSIFAYLAPLPTFMEICRKKSTLGFQSLPYVVALFSAMLWMYYAFLKTDAILLISVNSIGCFIETIYIAIYLAYASREARNHTAKLLASLNVGSFSVILLFTLLLIKDSNRVLVVGWVCVAISVSVFAAPLSIVFQVVRTRSVEFMPFTLSFFLTMTAIMWFGYGLLLKDLYIALPNILGFLLGILQMLLYGMYRNAKPVLELEKNQLPDQHMINIVVSGIPDEVHPMDAKMGSNEQTDHNNEKCSVDETSKANGQLLSPGLVVCIAS